MKYAHTAAFIVAGLMLAQMSSYNGGIPITPGTQVPEANPGTVVSTPQFASPAISPPAGAAIAPSAASGAPSGPAYSIGAAPGPVVSPGK